ncbi:RNA polymerase sigma factor [Catellatospora chokoriensis]|uniref:RNA polymerase n=1 Tax=Catellatospora chokoriensis TaxID=310353 RepID=A0A8J3NVU5_9ACTN|nr:sigma-70 family RNA polymerase sigma factor [Catellatospora chokoriensis]GIF94318.1 RNA polymerase [Catellatospora chokoriensis]
MTDVHTPPRPIPAEAVYRDHRDGLVRLAYLLTGSREQAEDLVQQAFATSWDRWSAIDQPLPYLKRAIVNMANDTRRRSIRDRLFRQRARVEPITEVPELDETWAHIKTLPPRQRAVVVLHYYDDRPLNEIAELLSRPAATVRSDLRRALERLRKVLK